MTQFALLVKYYIMNLCSTYATKKLVNIRTPVRRNILLSVFLLVSTVFVCVLRSNAPGVSLLAMVFISVCVHTLLFDIPVSTAVTATILAFGIEYACFFPPILIFALIVRLFPEASAFLEFWEFLIIGLMQVAMTFCLFRVRRLSHGLPFLSDSKYGDIGIYLSVSVFMILTLVGTKPEPDKASTAAVFLLLLCIFFLGFWIRKRMAQEYRFRAERREMEELQKTMELLKTENEVLSSIIHRDNKLIPTLDLSVKEYLIYAAKNGGQEELISHAKDLLSQIEAVSAERASTVRNYEDKCRNTANSGSQIIDALFSFMTHKARSANVSLECTVVGRLDAMFREAAAEQDVMTIAADLLDNAVIAAAHGNEKHLVRFELGKREGEAYYYIRCSDSGAPFPQEVLEHLGTRRITTHKEEGGSGIGLMTIVSLCKKTRASFSIVPCSGMDGCTKAVIIRFDGQCALPGTGE